MIKIEFKWTFLSFRASVRKPESTGIYESELVQQCDHARAQNRALGLRTNDFYEPGLQNSMKNR